MKFELAAEELDLLIRLIEGELEGINPEIRHSATSRVRNELRDERLLLKSLLARLHTGLGSGQEGRVVGL